MVPTTIVVIVVIFVVLLLTPVSIGVPKTSRKIITITTARAAIIPSMYFSFVVIFILAPFRFVTFFKQ